MKYSLNSLAGRPVAQRYHVTSDTFGREFDPGKRDFSHWWRTIKSFVHKIRRHGRQGKGMAEPFSREKLRHAPQKEGG